MKTVKDIKYFTNLFSSSFNKVIEISDNKIPQMSTTNLSINGPRKIKYSCPKNDL